MLIKKIYKIDTFSFIVELQRAGWKHNAQACNFLHTCIGL